jgi:hypothetical protein
VITHEQVLAAIDGWNDAHTVRHGDWVTDHCDDLRATAERHAPTPLGECHTCVGGMGMQADWPCEDYQQVIDRLTGWGVL